MVKLSKGDFNTPVIKYQSSAKYQVDGQGYFRIQVSGFNKIAVDKFLEELVIDLETKDSQPEVSNRETENSESQEFSIPYEDQKNQTSDEDLDINFRFYGEKSLKPYLVIIFKLDPAIGRDISHRYSFQDISHAAVSFSTDRGKIEAALYQGNREIGSRRVGSAETAELAKSVTAGESTFFTALVRGTRTDNYYRLNGDLTVT